MLDNDLALYKQKAAELRLAAGDVLAEISELGGHKPDLSAARLKLFDLQDRLDRFFND